MDLPHACHAWASIRALRGLAIDAIEHAGSGHPGLPLGAAPMAYVLWRHHLSHAPADPTWQNRDRFVLSAGHGSALLYGLLHLSGYSLAVDDLRKFRAAHSRTPGHPERGVTPGVEVTTGPLGQGAANSVGLALAQRLLAERFARPGHEQVFDHHTWALLSDGDVMSGVCFEAAALAGHWRLGRLHWLYDANDVTLDGPLSNCSGEDVAARFGALGWHVQAVERGDTDLAAIDRALGAARAEDGRPSLVIVRTTIGFGAPSKAGSARAHGSPLGPAEAQGAKAAFGLGAVGDFAVPAEGRAHMGELRALGAQRQAAWQKRFAAWQAAHGPLAEQWTAARRPQSVREAVSDLQEALAFDGPISTREASRRCLLALSERLPQLVGGDGDLAASTLSNIPMAPGSETPTAPVRNLHFGVREHAMAAITNGLACHGGLLPYAATFLAFCDYMRPAVRLAAMGGLHVLHVWTHDSVALGEDGPTHQPIEQLASLRAMPGLTLWRPADAYETMAAWQEACASADGGPQALVLTRQALPPLPTRPSRADVARGAWIVRDGGADTRIVLLATGSEVHVALDAAEALQADGVAARVVSMPCWERLAAMAPREREALLGGALPRLSVEAAATFGWHRWLGARGTAIGIDRFGLSAPGREAQEALGITAEAVRTAAHELLAGRPHET